MSPSPSDSLLQITHDGDRTAVRFAAGTSLTEANAEAFGRAMAELVGGRDDSATALDLALDLGGVEFLSSVALAKFIGLNRRVREAGGRLTLRNLRPVVREVFSITRLDTLLDIDPRPLPA